MSKTHAEDCCYWFALDPSACCCSGSAEDGGGEGAQKPSEDRREATAEEAPK